MTALRRADWRFLLPSPADTRFRRLVLLGAGADLPGRLAGIADEISTDPSDVGNADAVIVMADFAQPLDRVLHELDPRAVLYVEVDRRLPGRRRLTPARLARLLKAAELTPTAWHWVIPDFARARRHIPLDAPAALTWYLATLHTTGSPAARVADAGVRLLAWAGTHHLSAWLPCYTLTAVGRARGPSPVGALGGHAGPVAMLTSGQDDGSRVVLLPFDHGEQVPSRVVKVPRMAAFETHTLREQQTLADLRERLPPSLRPSLPTPLGVVRWNGLLLATESYAPGAPLVVSSGRYGARFARAREDLRRTVDWLVAFHSATRLDGAGWGEELARRTIVRLRTCGELFPEGAPVRGLLDAAARRAVELIGSRLPIVPLHNDLGPWNIHRDGDRVSVIDWELGDDAAAERTGPAVCDLFYFVTNWYFRVRHLRVLRAECRGLRTLFVTDPGTGEAGHAVHEEIRRYTTELGVSPGLLPLLLVSTWVDRAVERVERAVVAGDRGAPAGENRYARYLEILADRAGPWFHERRWP